MNQNYPGNQYQNYYGAPPPKKNNRGLFIAVIVALVILLLISGGMLIRYVSDYVSTKKGSDALRKINQQAMEEEMNQTAQAAAAVPQPTLPAATAIPAQAAVSAQASVASHPTQAPQNGTPSILPAVRYPTNYYAIVTNRFQKIQNQNKDIIGWLTIDGVLDEAVVQRDNQYYLRRDYRGYHNQNGSIFLDENCSLKSRPYTLILYGHNMKTGAMFGCLRNYENPTYYHKNPMITFDTAYENGRYVIFAVGTISTIYGNGKYVDFSKLNSTTVVWR